MLKRILSAIFTVIMLFYALTSCSEVQEGNDATARAPFDENGNMLCDYYILNVLINGIKPNAKDGYKYVVHRYQNIAENSWKDLVTYGEKIEQTEHAMAIYTSFGTNEESISFEYYGVPRTAATALKMVLRSELKNSGVLEIDGFPYFCAEVLSIGTDRITVAPLDGTIEKYISKVLTVSTETSGLGITADKLSVGDCIRIFYDGGIFKHGINIRGVFYYEQLSRELEFGNKTATVSFFGMGRSRDNTVADVALNPGEFTDGTIPGRLPVSIIESEEELLSYFENVKTSPEAPNSKFILTECDFKNNSLIAVFLRSPSISYTYEITKLALESGLLTLKVSESNAPPMPMKDEICYVIFIEANKKLVSSVTDFDVTLIN